MKIVIQPGEVAKMMANVVGMLTLFNIIALVLYFTQPETRLINLIVRLFDFDMEGNIPILYSALAIAFAGLLLFLIASSETRKLDGKRWQWLVCNHVFPCRG